MNLKGGNEVWSLTRITRGAHRQHINPAAAETELISNFQEQNRSHQHIMTLDLSSFDMLFGRNAKYPEFQQL